MNCSNLIMLVKIEEMNPATALTKLSSQSGTGNPRNPINTKARTKIKIVFLYAIFIPVSLLLSWQSRSTAAMLLV